MTKIHMILQGKGGVGKSMIAATLAQYKAGKGTKPLCIDTDPVNATFEGYKALNVRRLNIMEGDEINTRNFDALVEMIASAEGDVIIDNGASSFVPLSSYLIGNQVPALLQEMGHELVVHTVVTGGQAFKDTVIGFTHLAAQFPSECVFVVWLQGLREDESLHRQQGAGVGHHPDSRPQGRNLRPGLFGNAPGATHVR